MRSTGIKRMSEITSVPHLLKVHIRCRLSAIRLAGMPSDAARMLGVGHAAFIV